MKQLSPAKLRKPLLRKPGAERGQGASLDEIEWDEALAILTKRLKHIRATEPRKLAFFTGRDQMQALTGLWAQQFGTPNWAAHGGFWLGEHGRCRALHDRILVLGVRRSRLGSREVLRAVGRRRRSLRATRSRSASTRSKRHGAKFVSINPVRTGYSAIADQWIPIRPGDRRSARAVDRPRAARRRDDRLRVSCTLYECAVAGGTRTRHGGRLLFSRVIAKDDRWSTTTPPGRSPALSRSTRGQRCSEATCSPTVRMPGAR